MELNTEDKTLKAEPNGYINVMWPKVDRVELPTARTRMRTVLGWVALIAVTLLFGALAWREPPMPRGT